LQEKVQILHDYHDIYEKNLFYSVKYI